MKNNQNKLFACLPLILLGTTSMYAQKKELSKKEQKRLDKALAIRLNGDLNFAKKARTRFNQTSWVGSTLSELIKSWGPPSRTITDGGDGSIVIYTSSTSYSGGSYKPGYTEYNGLGQVVGGANAVDTRYSKSSVHQADIYVDKDGIVQHIEIKFDTYYN